MAEEKSKMTQAEIMDRLQRQTMNLAGHGGYQAQDDESPVHADESSDQDDESPDQDDESPVQEHESLAQEHENLAQEDESLVQDDESPAFWYYSPRA